MFQARVQMVDLQGAWLISPKKVLQSSITCSNVKAGDTPSVDANGAEVAALVSGGRVYLPVVFRGQATLAPAEVYLPVVVSGQ